MRSGGGSSDRGFDAIVGFAIAIHIRVVTPITTQGFRSPEDATQLECDGVKVDFVNIETGPVVRTRVFESRGTTEHENLFSFWSCS
jgi:hypothetical protein